MTPPAARDPVPPIQIVHKNAPGGLALVVLLIATPAVGRAQATRVASIDPDAGTAMTLGPTAGTRSGDGGREFRTAQLREPRVRAARASSENRLRELFAARGVAYPSNVLFRVFKAERVLEVWALDASSGQYVLLADYPVCASSGHLGPKRQRGDRQVPEGFYHLDAFNPRSQFHLSMRVSYPNPVDRALGRTDRLGGDIYLHGGCATVGCIPVTDDVIDQLYWLSVEARAAGEEEIPIHIYPSRMEGAPMDRLWEEANGDYSTWRFWLSLKAGYDYFQTYHRLPEVSVDDAGFYRIRS